MFFPAVTVPYHQQDYDTYCGPVAAQMVLAGLDPHGITWKQQDLLQAGLYSVLDNGGTPPAVLRQILNCKRPSGSGDFQEFFDCDFDRSCQRIAATLTGGQPAGVPALVNGAGHWVVVMGVELDRAPSAGQSLAIKAFYVHNPLPMTAAIMYKNDPAVRPPPRPPPMEHGWGDHCGTGSPHMFGTPNQMVSLDRWRTWWGTHPTSTSDKSEYVAIVRGPIAPLVTPEPRDSWSEMMSSVNDGISIDQLHDAAVRGIEEYRILGAGRPLAALLAGSEVGAGTMVVELGEPKRRSWHVRMMRRDQQVGTIVLNADTGAVLGAQATQRFAGDSDFDRVVRESVVAAGIYGLPTMDEMREHVLKAFERRPALYEQYGRGFASTEEWLTIFPTLVWRPCRASMSPDQPFVQVSVAGAILYVGMDGRVHRELQPHDLL